MFDLKRFRGVIFHGDAKFEEKLTYGLEHDKEYRKFSPEQFPLQFGREDNISGNSIERRVYILIYFEN